MDGRPVSGSGVVSGRGRFLPMATMPVLGVVTVAVCLVVLAVLILVSGENPLDVAAILIERSILEESGRSNALVRAIPLTLLGLGITVSFRAGVFNIGADGQLLVGAALGVGLAPMLSAVPPPLGMVVFLAFGALGGALWAGIAGFLRARYQANEIIVTIMLTYIAYQLLSWLVRGPIQEAMGILPRTDAIDAALELPGLLAGSRLHGGLVVAAIATVALWVVMTRGRFGYKLKVTGKNPAAASFGGVRHRWIVFWALTISGAFAGLAGAVEVAGIHGRLQEGIDAGMGITAIAVALLARLNPLLVPVSAMGFALLYVGSGALSRDTAVPFPLVNIIEAAVILGYLALTVVRRRAGGADD